MSLPGLENCRKRAGVYPGQQEIELILKNRLWLSSLLLLSGCAGPQSGLEPAGPNALAIAWLWWGMFAGFALVLVVVVALWIYALKRTQQQLSDSQAYRVGQRWIIGGGLVLPIVSILLILAVGIPAGYRMLPIPSPDHRSLRVDVVGHQWWWEVHYPDSGVTTANELHLPVGVPVNIHTTSTDVIHSFWVPRLGGKVDALPGRTNILRLHASETGSFRGQCAEFCGERHAHMVLAVEVHSGEDFADWLQARQQPVVPPPAPETLSAFQQDCGGCHRVAGISDGGRAPDLSTVGARELLGGRPRDPQGILHWLNNHETAKFGHAIPDHSKMAPDAREAIAGWLETLGHD